jgi:hypothetical protein
MQRMLQKMSGVSNISSEGFGKWLNGNVQSVKQNKQENHPIHIPRYWSIWVMSLFRVPRVPPPNPPGRSLRSTSFLWCGFFRAPLCASPAQCLVSSGRRLESPDCRKRNTVYPVNLSRITYLNLYKGILKYSQYIILRNKCNNKTVIKVAGHPRYGLLAWRQSCDDEQLLH